MPNYISEAEVIELILDQARGVHNVTTAQVGEIIDGIEGQIDGVLLAQGYTTVPATGARDVAMLGYQVGRKAAATVYELLKQPVDRSPDWVRTWNIDFAEWLDALRDGKLRLVDQLPSVGQAGEVLITTLRVLPRVDGDA